jgi:hypothetical protein
MCTVEFYPNADPVKGLIDLWFQKWCYPRKKCPGPFFNVIHSINGPYMEKDGGELYFIDFGTAPAAAFCDFITYVCRNGIDRIAIR